MRFRGGKFYGAGGPYASLIGKDASIALATDSLSLDEQVTELNEKQQKRLEEWTRFFQNKYPCIGSFSP